MKFVVQMKKREKEVSLCIRFKILERFLHYPYLVGGGGWVGEGGEDGTGAFQPTMIRIMNGAHTFAL